MSDPISNALELARRGRFDECIERVTTIAAYLHLMDVRQRQVFTLTVLILIDCIITDEKLFTNNNTVWPELVQILPEREKCINSPSRRHYWRQVFQPDSLYDQFDVRHDAELFKFGKHIFPLTFPMRSLTSADLSIQFLDDVAGGLYNQIITNPGFVGDENYGLLHRGKEQVSQLEQLLNATNALPITYLRGKITELANLYSLPIQHNDLHNKKQKPKTQDSSDNQELHPLNVLITNRLMLGHHALYYQDLPEQQLGEWLSALDEEPPLFGNQQMNSDESQLNTNIAAKTKLEEMVPETLQADTCAEILEVERKFRSTNTPFTGIVLPVMESRKQQLRRILLTLAKKDVNDILIIGETKYDTDILVRQIQSALRLEGLLVPKELAGKPLIIPKSEAMLNYTIESAVECILVIPAGEISDAIAGNSSIRRLLVAERDGLANLRKMLKDTNQEDPFLTYNVFHASNWSTEEIIIILENVQDYYSFHHDVELETVIRDLVTVANRYLLSTTSISQYLSLLDMLGVVATGVKATKDDVNEAISMFTDVRISPFDNQIENYLKEKVVGQKSAVNQVANAVRRYQFKISDPNKPIASFMFVGPSGVGKTELAKQLAIRLFGSESAMIRIDMSEYAAHEDAVFKLIGSDRVWTHSTGGGRLTDALKAQSYGILLLDEIEKAHPQVHNLLLQAVDEGFITSGAHEKVSLRNYIICMTSNAGIEQRSNSGFAKEPGRTTYFSDQKFTQTFPPEFLGRLSAVIEFESLDDQSLCDIVHLKLWKLAERLKDAGFALHWDNAVERILVAKSDHSGGARSLDRVIEEQVTTPLISKAIEMGDISNLIVAVFETTENKIGINIYGGDRSLDSLMPIFHGSYGLAGRDDPSQWRIGLADMVESSKMMPESHKDTQDEMQDKIIDTNAVAPIVFNPVLEGSASVLGIDFGQRARAIFGQPAG